jgi:hypothetical protein
MPGVFCRALMLASALGAVAGVRAEPLIRFASGAAPADLNNSINQFRTDLGGANNGVGDSFGSGRREINWDGVPSSSAEPNFMAPDFFNTVSPRGMVLNTVDESTGLNDLRISANAASGVAPRFANIDASYANTFKTFSAERLLHARNARALDLSFFVPGTDTPASVAGFGAVFSDIDAAGQAQIRCFGIDGRQLLAVNPSALNAGLSFVGFSFSDSSERCARVQIKLGSQALAAGITDGGGRDLIALDDIFFGEPQALPFAEGTVP